MNIEFNVLDRLFFEHQREYEEAALRVLRSGWYILGKELETFEQEFASFCGVEYCVGVGNGLDALTLALRALEIGEGDEVIVPAHTYIASVLGVTQNLATPRFVEPDEFYNMDASKLEAAITPRTKAVMVVHLYGQAANMQEILSICEKHNLYVIEDCAQSHSSCFNGQITGTFGHVGCYSFFPTKNLGAFGDAGAVVTCDKHLAYTLQKLRNYGSRIKYQHEIKGVNSRLDEIQAALLRVRLRFLKDIVLERQALAGQYLSGISNPHIKLPLIRDGADHIWHLFVIQTEERDRMQKYLIESGIKTQIHYPIPPHLASCYSTYGYQRGAFPISEYYSNHVLSLPLFNGMKQEEIQYIIKKLNQFS